ncbi:MAG: DUF4386 domain-containing protein [Anaerolineales bacterium]
MNSFKNTARMVGALFLIAMAASLVGGIGFVEPSLSSSDFLASAVENQTQVRIGVLLELANALAVLGIGALMYPVLKGHSENAAVGYLALRIAEAVFCSLIVVTPLSIIGLGKDALLAGAGEAAAFQAAGILSIANRAGISSLLIPVFLGVGALVLYTTLYRSQLVPRYIAARGLISAVLILVLNLLLTFDIQLGDLAMVFALPIITNEIYLGCYLIIKGFRPAQDPS